MKLHTLCLEYMEGSDEYLCSGVLICCLITAGYSAQKDQKGTGPSSIASSAEGIAVQGKVDIVILRTKIFRWAKSKVEQSQRIRSFGLYA